MKRTRFAAALILFVLAIAGTSYASQGNATIPITYSNIKVYINGDLLEPKDSAGNLIEPFTYNGTVYLPARAISEALGKKVEWDGKTSSASIYDPPQESVTLTAGFYTAGTDIAAGKYNVTLNSGSGNFFVRGDRTIVNEIFGADNDYYISEFKNLTLQDGYVVEIRGGLSVTFTKV